jgi:hypothetical protein
MNYNSNNNNNNHDIVGFYLKERRLLYMGDGCTTFVRQAWAKYRKYDTSYRAGIVNKIIRYIELIAYFLTLGGCP